MKNVYEMTPAARFAALVAPTEIGFQQEIDRIRAVLRLNSLVIRNLTDGLPEPYPGCYLEAAKITCEKIEEWNDARRERRLRGAK